MSGDARLILVAGALLAAGVLAAMAASRLRLPALLLFLGVGMAVGSDGLGWIYLDDYVFFAVLVSTLLQGATVEPLARALGLSNRPDAP